MATNKSEKYYRLVLLLAKGCTKLVRKVTVKQIERSTLPGQEPDPLTVDQFLQYHKDDQCMKKLNEKQKRVLYVDTGTDIEEWDLQLLCVVLEGHFTLNPTMKMDIIKLKKLRNKLCHKGDPSVTDSEYQSYMFDMKVIIGRFTAILKDDELTKEILTLIEQIEIGALSVEDTMKTLKAWLDREKYIDDNLECLKEGQREMLTMMKQTDRKLESTKSDIARILAILQGPSTKYQDVPIPDTNLRIDIENCDKDRESYISNILITFLDPKLRQRLSDEALINSIKESATGTEALIDFIKESVAEALAEWLKDGKTIVNLIQECVVMRLKCPSFQSLKALWTDCAEGTITTLFQPVQQAIRQLDGCDNVRLEVIVPEKEFWRCLKVLEFGATENKEKRSKDDDLCPSLDETESEQDSNRDHSAGVSSSDVLKQRIEDKETKEQIIAEQCDDIGTCGSGDIDQSCSSGHMVDLTDKNAGISRKRSKMRSLQPSKYTLKKPMLELPKHYESKDSSIQNWHTCLISAMIEMLQTWIDIHFSSNICRSNKPMVNAVLTWVHHISYRMIKILKWSRDVSIHVLKRVIPTFSEGLDKQHKTSVVISLDDLEMYLRNLLVMLTEIIEESKIYQERLKTKLETKPRLATQGSYKVVKKETHKEEKALLEEVLPVTRSFGDKSRINVIDKDRYETNLRTTEIDPTTTKTALEKGELLSHSQDHIKHLKISKKKETDSAEETVLEVILSLSRPFDAQPTGSVIDQVHHKKHELPETILKQQQDHDDAVSTIDELITRTTVVNGFWKNMIDQLDSVGNYKMDSLLKNIEDPKYTKQFQTSLGKVIKSWEWLERICDFYATNEVIFWRSRGIDVHEWHKTKSALQDIKSQFEEELHAN